MNETAAYLVDQVIGEVPIRHWVLTLPPPLRYRVAHDTSLCSAVLAAFVRSVFGCLRAKAKRELDLRSLKQAEAAAVTSIQRASSHLALNPHFHSLVTDGVYVQEEGSAKPTFRALSAPTKAEVANVAWQTCKRVCKALRKRGLWLDSDAAGDGDGVQDPLVQEEPGLAACCVASLQGVLLLGPRAGQRLMRLYGHAAGSDAGIDRAPQAQVQGYGFNVHAQTRIAAHDRQGLGRLCRYLHRPPLAQGRLELRPNGNVRLGLKRQWEDGTQSIVFEPLDFLSKLAALVPPPRMHRTRYHGLWASHAKARAAVVPACAGDAQCPDGHADSRGGTEKAPAGERRSKRYAWAKLMARAFAIDVLCCAKCGSRMQRIAFVTRPASIRAVLSSVGLPADAPEPAPARRDGQQDLFAVA